MADTTTGSGETPTQGNNPVGAAGPTVTLGDDPVGSPNWITKNLPLIQLLGGLGAQFGGAVLQQGQLNKGYDYLNQLNQTAQGNSADGKFAAAGPMSGATAASSSMLNGSNPWMQMLSQGLMGNIQSLNNLLPGLIGDQSNNLVYQDPNMAAQVGGITDLTANTSGMMNAAGGLINSGGQTSAQSPLAAFAQMLMGSRAPGQTNLLNAGNTALDSSGMTPALASAIQTASGIASGGGRTPITDQLAQRGQALAASNPLMSLDQTASFAQDQAAHQYQNLARNSAAQANARGAGAGAVVANGAGNDTMADYSDQALAGTSAAMQNALLGRQSLGLQQLNSGLNTGLSAAQLQQALQTGGLGALTSLTNASTSRLGTGGALTSDALGSAAQGGTLYNALLGNQTQNLGLGFQAGNAATGQQANLLQTALTDLMQGRTSGANIGQMLAQLYGQNTDRLASGIGQGLSSDATAAQQLGTQGSTWLDYAKSMMGDATSTGSSVANLLKQPNAFSAFLNNISGGGTPRVSVSAGAGAARGPAGPAGPAGPSGPTGTPPYTYPPWSTSQTPPASGGGGTANSTITYPGADPYGDPNYDSNGNYVGYGSGGSSDGNTSGDWWDYGNNEG